MEKETINENELHDNQQNEQVIEQPEQVAEQSANQEQTTQQQAEAQPQKSELQVLQEKYDVLNDKYLRMAAEYDNYRKRTLKERSELIKSAGQDVLVGVLPVVDNFERALRSMETAKEVEPVKEGVVLIYNAFREFLKQRGIKEMEAMNKAFDTDLHEAITKIPAPNNDMKGKVIDVIEKGYLMHDKVVRFAKVVVGE